MVTANAILRTFRIKYKERIGTCFIIDKNTNRYMITAKHIVKDIASHDTIQIYYDKHWKDLPVNLMAHCRKDIDISVLSGSFDFVEAYDLNVGTDKLAVGQDVYILGFPDIVDINKIRLIEQDKYPYPVERKTILSAVEDDKIILDGYANKGFSGGPVIFKSYGSSTLSVAAVISRTPVDIKPVYRHELNTKNEDSNDIIGYFRQESNFLYAYLIKHAVDLIDN